MTQTSHDRAARETWAAHYATRSGFRYLPSEELVRFVGRRGHRGLGRVLEVGCGNGANLWFLAEHGDLAVGIDFYEPVLADARGLCRDRGCGQETADSRPGHRRWKSPAVVAAASAFALPFGEATFDTVVELMVSQHVPSSEHAALYSEYRRVLKPGGHGFLYHLVRPTTVPDGPFTFDYEGGIPLFPDVDFMCLPYVSSLAYWFAQSGFGNVEQRGLTRTYPDGAQACYAVLEGLAQ